MVVVMLVATVVSKVNVDVVVKRSVIVPTTSIETVSVRVAVPRLPTPAADRSLTENDAMIVPQS